MEPIAVSSPATAASVSLAACSSRAAKRKTPSELRLEQRKRSRVAEDENGQKLAQTTNVTAVSISKPKLGTFSCPQAPTAPCFAFKNVTQLSAVNACLEPVSQSPADGGRAFPLGGKRIVVPDKPTAPECSLATTQRDIPLDFSLKNAARVVSSNSLHWCHHLSISSRFHGLKYILDMFNSNDSRIKGRRLGSTLSDKGTAAAYFWEALHSWVHPQSSLPPRSASADAQGKKQDHVFYVQRTRLWESAFQSLYFMFRNKLCSIFYVCSQQFVVMFVGGVIGGRQKDACSAFLTRSTRGLRSLLQAQDLQFTMPLSEVEQGAAAEEDLHELNELEKIRPGQTKFVDAMAAIDNSTSSILAFEGLKNVHRLYDFLLNQRFLVPSSASADVPVLLSPVAFEHGTLAKPELVCKEMQCAEFPDKRGIQGAPGAVDLNVTYTVDVKGMLLPPWVITRMCNVLEIAQPTGFEISLPTDALTEGLNVAQATARGMDSTASECPTTAGSYAQEVPHSSGIGTSSVKHLKFRDNAYTVGLAMPTT